MKAMEPSRYSRSINQSSCGGAELHFGYYIIGLKLKIDYLDINYVLIHFYIGSFMLNVIYTFHLLYHYITLYVVLHMSMEKRSS